jgi:hypothetical protein
VFPIIGPLFPGVSAIVGPLKPTGSATLVDQVGSTDETGRVGDSRETCCRVSGEALSAA